MPAIQSSYPTSIPAGFPGLVANMETFNSVTKTVEDATAIGFGRAVWRGTGDDGVTLAATANTLIGFVIADKAQLAYTPSATVDAVPQYADCAVLTQGVIWVTVSGNTTDGAQVYVTPTGGTITATSTSNVAATGWFFEDTQNGGGLVRIAKR